MSLFRKPIIHPPPSRNSNPFATRFFTPGAIPFYFDRVPLVSSENQSALRENSPEHQQAIFDALLSQIFAGQFNSQGERWERPNSKSTARERSNRPKRCSCFAIVGPHGTGKSTLLAQLEQAILETYSHRSCQSLFLNSSSSSRQSLTRALRLLKTSSICLIDGFEQLPKWGQTLCVWTAKSLHRKLIATSHALPKGFVPLWNTQMSPEIERYVIGQLLNNVPAVESEDDLEQRSSNFKNRELLDLLLESEEWRTSRAKHRENLRESLFDMYDWWGNRVDEILGNR